MSLFVDQEKRRSFSNVRTIKPSTPTIEQDSVFCTRRVQDAPNYLNQRMTELSVGSSHVEEIGTYKVMNPKTPKIANTPRLTPAKASGTPKRRTEPSKMVYGGRNRESVCFR